MTELTKKTTGFLAEFRQFIARGNVLDMAVGVIIGGGFIGIVVSIPVAIILIATFKYFRSDIDLKIEGIKDRSI